MSLIEEALRRVQDPLLSKTQTTPPPSVPKKAPRAETTAPAAHSWPTTSPSPFTAYSATTVNPLIAVTLAVVALTVVCVIGGAFWMGRTIAKTEPLATAIAKEGAAEPKISPAVSPSPAQASEAKKPPATAISHAKPPQGNLVLTGVVEGEGGSFAVINGMIIGVGEQAGDATLEEIVKGRVKLRHANGTETILQLSR